MARTGIFLIKSSGVDAPCAGGKKDLSFWRNAVLPVVDNETIHDYYKLDNLRVHDAYFLALSIKSINSFRW